MIIQIKYFHDSLLVIFAPAREFFSVYVPFDFIPFYLFLITFAMKLKNANYESHWNILVFCDQRKVMSDLNLFSGKNVWLCFVPIVSLHFCHKTTKFRFWKSFKYFFYQNKYDVRLFPGKMPDFVSFPLFGFT